MDPSENNLSVVIFAYNEAANLPQVLTELSTWLRRNEPGAEIVFVDDGSTDETLTVARKELSGQNAVFVRHEQNRGIGASLKSGVRSASKPWVTFLPADGQIQPEAIGTLRERQKRSGAELVFSVYRDRDDGLHRKMLSWSVRSLITLIHGAKVTSDGPYLFQRDMFLPDELHSESFFVNFEFPILATKAGIKTEVVTIECRPRISGVSKSTQWRRIGGVAKELVAFRVRRLF